MNREKTFTVYLVAISLLGMVFAFIVTYRYGAGLSTDGARYLSAAENLINGKGFTEYLGVPLTQFPPFYSLVIAIFSYLFKADVFVTAQYLNIITFGIVIWLAGTLFRKLFQDEYLFLYFGSMVFVSSVSLIRIASNVLSDLLFLTLTIAFLIIATDYLKDSSPKNVLLLGLVSTILPLQRYTGLAFILSGSFLVLLSSKKKWFKGVFSAGKFGVLTSIPIIGWVFFHNYLQTGILFGVHRAPSIMGNVEIAINKTVHWFVPYSITERIPEWAIIVTIFIILVTGNRSVDWKKWKNQLISPNFLPSLVFLIVYGAVLILMVSYTEIRWPFVDRIHIIILPSVMAVGFITMRELMPFYLRRIASKTLHRGMILLFVVWLAYPINNIQKTLRSAIENGETSEYNLYNTRAQNESGIREFVKSLPITSQDKVYSNYEPLAWLYARHTILKLPQGPVSPEPPDPSEVLMNYPDWPGMDGAGYVIWMKQLGFKEYVLSPDQLNSKADFELLFTSKQGDVYRISPK